MIDVLHFYHQSFYSGNRMLNQAKSPLDHAVTLWVSESEGRR